MRRWLPLALLVLLALTAFTGLGSVEALDERESRDLVTAFESTNHREWLTPVFAYEPFFDKPLPGYAHEVVARRFLRRLWPGDGGNLHEVMLSRLVRGVLAVALAFAVVHLGMQAFGARAGWLAGCALVSMLGVPLATRTDGVQLYATLLAWLGIGRLVAALTGATRAPGASVLLGWLALGAAGTTGGPWSALWPVLGFALYFALARHHDGWRRLDPWSGAFIVIGTCLPWYGLMVAIHGPSFLAHVPWFPYAAGVRGSWWLAAPLALSFAVVASFPWTPLLGAAFADIGARLRRAPAPAVPGGPLDMEHREHLLLALSLAALVPVALWPGPPLTAALPALPAVALLVGRFVDRVLDGAGDPRAITHATRLLAAIGTGFALLGTLLAARMPEAAPALRLFSAVLFGAVWTPLLADLRGARKVAVALFVLPAALCVPLVHVRLLPALEPWLNARGVAETLRRVADEDTPLVVLETPPTSLRQALGHNLVARTRVTADDRDVRARDGAVYAAFRPAHEGEAMAALAPLGGTSQVLQRTPVLVLVRVRPATP